MGMTLKDMLRRVTPPVFVQIARWVRAHRPAGDLGLSGDYRRWDEAMARCTGYDCRIILERTIAALTKVKYGEAAYERDSVLFDEIEYSWPMLAGLLWVAAQSGGTLNVLDFGGSLGSSYFQNRAILSRIRAVRWNVIEQSSHVMAGKERFEDDILRFYPDIAACVADTQPNVVLFSSVLQYLERPFAVLDQIKDLSCNHFVIDRTPFWDGPKDRLCVQTVPSSIYPASYPSWIFSRQRFHVYLVEGWRIMAEFDSLDSMMSPVETVWRGLILERKMNPESKV